MKSDNELQMWRQQWHSQPPVPIDLIGKVERQTAYMKIYRAAEILVTVVIGGGSIVIAAVTGNPILVVLSCGTWLFIVFAWIFSLRQTRGLWAPGAPTTASYLDLSIRRCKWRIADARYDTVQGILLTLFVFVIDYKLLAGKAFSSPAEAWWLWVLCALMMAGIWSVFANKERKAKAELEYLTALRRELEE